MTRRVPCPHPRLRSSLLEKGMSTNRSTKIWGWQRKLPEGKGQCYSVETAHVSWSPRQPRFGLQMQPTTVRECRWIRPSWKWLLVRERWSEMQLDRVFLIIFHYKWGLFPQNNKCIMCRIWLSFEKWKLSLTAEEGT